MAKGHRRTWVQSHLGMLVVLLLRQRIPEDFCQDGFREKGWSFSSTEREYLHLASSITVHGLKVGPHKSYIYIHVLCDFCECQNACHREKKITCLIHVTVSFKIPKHPQMRTTAGCGCTTAGCGCTETPASVSKKHCECNTTFLWSFSLPSDKDRIQQDEQGTWGFELTAINTKAVDCQKQFFPSWMQWSIRLLKDINPWTSMTSTYVNMTYPFRTAL